MEIELIQYPWGTLVAVPQEGPDLEHTELFPVLYAAFTTTRWRYRPNVCAEGMATGVLPPRSN